MRAFRPTSMGSPSTRTIDIGAAGVQFPRLQRFYIAVDSRADAFTNRPQKGKYILNAWMNDLTPAGRPRPDDEGHRRPPAARRPGGRPRRRESTRSRWSSITTARSSAPPLYDPDSGAGRLRHPGGCAEVQGRQDDGDRRAPPTTRRRRTSTPSGTTLPEHGLPADSKLTVVNGPTVTWIEPPSHVCAFKSDRLSWSPAQRRRSRTSRSRTGRPHRRGQVRPRRCVLVAWNTKSLKKGTRHLLATVTDASGHQAAAGRALKICK